MRPVRVALRALAATLLVGTLASAVEPEKPATKPAAKGPAYRLNVYFPADFKDAPYQKAAFQRVLGAWRPKGTPPAAGKKTVVIAILGRDGKLLGADLNLESGSAGFDEAAIDAVRKAAPFNPLPKGYAPSSIEVHWHFEVGG